MDSVSPDSPDDKVSSFDEDSRNFLLLNRCAWVMWGLVGVLSGLVGFGRIRT